MFHQSFLRYPTVLKFTHLTRFLKNNRNYASTTKQPVPTQERYSVKRGNFSQLTDSDIQKFQTIIDPSRVITDEFECEQYNIDWLKTLRGHSRLILKPKSTQEVSEILKYCNERKLAVCPQSGNTGLVGGSVPVFDEVVISLKLLNRIEKVDEYAGVLVCEAGCILETLEEKAHEKGLIMPLDLGAKGSCLIGGNVSTNAGGLRLLRYGNLHGSVLGVEAVMANGQIIDLMSNFKKDNTGYHLKHLFIGSEGTLGIVTKVAMFLPAAPKSVSVAFLGVSSYDSVLQTFLAAKRDLGEILSSFELIDRESLDVCVKSHNLVSPISEYPFYILIETSGSRSDHNEEKLTQFLEIAMSTGHVSDGTITTDHKKIQQIWQIREQIPTALMKIGHLFTYDVTIPLANFYEIVLATRAYAGDFPIVVCGFGHLGDCNMHICVVCKGNLKDKMTEDIEPFIFQYVKNVRGSISSEHGIGHFKPQFLSYSKSQESINMMKQLKQMFDPNGILNPYKVLC